MSFLGRSWPKIGKKLLQAGVTPLANQLVDPNDSVLGPYSNQPGNPNPSLLCSRGSRWLHAPLASRTVRVVRESHPRGVLPAAVA